MLFFQIEFFMSCLRWKGIILFCSLSSFMPIAFTLWMSFNSEFIHANIVHRKVSELAKQKIHIQLFEVKDHHLPNIIKAHKVQKGRKQRNQHKIVSYWLDSLLAILNRPTKSIKNQLQCHKTVLCIQANRKAPATRNELNWNITMKCSSNCTNYKHYVLAVIILRSLRLFLSFSALDGMVYVLCFNA